MASITSFKVGYCLHPGCMALKGAGWQVCKFPARAWLLETQGKRWLWDTGYADHFEYYTSRGIYRLYNKITPVCFNSGDALFRQLKRQGISTKDIQGLIISHFHGDHIAGLRDFRDVPSICSAIGWKKCRALRGLAALKRAFVPDLIPEDFEIGLRFMEHFERIALPAECAPFAQGFALPDSRHEIIMVPLPGHAFGHIGAFVQTDIGWVLLASDAAWSPVSYQRLQGPSRLAHWIMDDVTAYYHTLMRLHQLYLRGQTEIRLCHEGEL
ncbi:MBL fold metallo-hydrolase [Acerihabitans sp. KWT182]|uniref:MBL fold metallo-hydrolase n=1 Tax=Acerihabitans sp. KWT182 TaxID=3157919 RepID=A0AAU7QAE1_9GAMM